MQKIYISNKNESPRLFKNDFLEILTHVHWSVPILLYVPGSIYFLTRPTPAVPATRTLVFLAGIGFWTFTEYLLHRFVFHYQPSSAWGRRIHFLAHGLHHDYPNDATRLVMPPSVSIPLAVLFYALFSVVIPSPFLPVFFAAFLLGYVCYDTIHYAIHHAPMNGRVAHWLKQQHLRHHFVDDQRGFGVSTPVWDYVFRTVYVRKKVSQRG